MFRKNWNSIKYIKLNSGAGKEPSWKDQVVLTYFDEIQIFVKAYDDDATEK